MANEDLIGNSSAKSSDRPNIRRIGTADLKDALVKGLADFNAMPTHLVFLGLIYPIVTLIFARAYAGLDVLPLVFPLLAGYTLIGPLVATGMYELSRRREQGLYTSRANAFEVFRSPSILATGVLGVVLLVIYFAWLLAAWAIYVLNFGDAAPDSVTEFAQQVVTTPAGWTLIVEGSGAGFLFAVAVLALSVVSFPLLLDRHVGVMVAIKTSIRAVVANPVTIAIWGVVVAVALVLGSLPLFVGLAVVMPVLGHATWHLYRKIVEF
jgi:uncharacterized membrane protein